MRIRTLDHETLGLVVVTRSRGIATARHPLTETTVILRGSVRDALAALRESVAEGEREEMEVAHGRA